MDAAQRQPADAVMPQRVAVVTQVAAVEPPQQVAQQPQVAVDAEVAQLRQPDRLTPWSFDSLQSGSS